MVNGKRVSNDIQAAEKWYLDLRLEVRNKGGHSSLPVPDNAIYRLAGALVRLSQFGFPLKTNEVTRAYFAGMARINTTRPESRPRQGRARAIARGHEAHRRGLARLEFHAAHHLRRHHAGRRPRPQRAAAARRRQRQLPRPARRFRCEYVMDT